MTLAAPNPEDLDRVGHAAAMQVQDGMLVGLGTGKAAEAFVHRLAERLRAGVGVRGVPTSERSAKLASDLGIPLTTLDDVERLDLAVDGADEVAPDLSLVKGLGGAMLRERVVAAAADRFIVLVTPEKLVARLGTRCPTPIEVVPFAAATVARQLQRQGAGVVARTRGDSSYLTDNGNLVLDAEFGPMDDPREVHERVSALPGVVTTGIFLGMVSMVLVGHPGRVEELRPR